MCHCLLDKSKGVFLYLFYDLSIFKPLLLITFENIWTAINIFGNLVTWKDPAAFSQTIEPFCFPVFVILKIFGVIQIIPNKFHEFYITA